MPESESPLVSVVTVNFNGAELTSALLESLRHQTYRHHEVVVVDNASSDGSVELLRQRFPEARILARKTNAGFVGGNNAGIRAARGPWVALANNDTVAEPRWLEELVATVGDEASADDTENVGAVASKILFLHRFVEVRVEVLEDDGTEDSVEAPVLVGEESQFAGSEYRKPVFRQGFGGGRKFAGMQARALESAGTLYLPVPPGDGPATLELKIAGPRRRRLRVAVGEELLGVAEAGPEARTERWTVPGEVVTAEAFDLINNAGTHLSESGVAADRGIYEPDRGQYDTVEEVESICGAAVLLRRSALEECGLFDRDFFMYYEDTDLSWRLRKGGYRLLYQPRSVIRHVHAASSVEWSPLFVFHTARNRVLMIAKNSSLGALLGALRDTGRSMLGALLRAWRSPEAEDRQQAGRELATRLRVQASLLWQLPKALLKRLGVLPN